MANETIRDFENSLPMLLMRAREAVMTNFAPFLREHNLSPQQWRVLRILSERDNLDATELALICHLLLPSVSRIIRNLESRDLIHRVPDPGDQRRSLISITPRGRQLFDELARHSESRYDEIEQLLGPKKVDQLYALLKETIEKLSAQP